MHFKQADMPAILKHQAGQALVELVIAMAILAILTASIASLALGGLASQAYLSQMIQAQALADEAIEAVRFLAADDISGLANAKSTLSVSGGTWILASADAAVQIGGFLRTIEFFPVYRDNSLNIVAASHPEAVLDENSKKAMVTIEWDRTQGRKQSLSRSVYVASRQ